MSQYQTHVGTEILLYESVQQVGESYRQALPHTDWRKRWAAEAL